MFATTISMWDSTVSVRDITMGDAEDALWVVAASDHAAHVLCELFQAL